MFKGTFAKIGIRNLKWINFDRVTERTPEQREHMLCDAETRFATL